MTSFACHCRSRTLLGRGRYTRTLLCIRTLQKLDPSKFYNESTISSDYTRWLNLSKLRHLQLLGPPSHNCLWRVQTGGYQLSTIWPTWVKGCQLSTIRLTWVKDCQLLTIRVQWRSEWRVISYQQYKYNDDLSEKLSVINDTTNLSEGLPVINDMSVKMTCVVYDLSKLTPAEAAIVDCPWV